MNYLMNGDAVLAIIAKKNSGKRMVSDSGLIGPSQQTHCLNCSKMNNVRPTCEYSPRWPQRCTTAGTSIACSGQDDSRRHKAAETCWKWREGALGPGSQ